MRKIRRRQAWIRMWRTALGYTREQRRDEIRVLRREIEEFERLVKPVAPQEAS